MRFLADENVEQPIVDRLREAGHDVAYIAETAPGTRDEEVLRLANAESRILLLISLTSSSFSIRSSGRRMFPFPLDS